MSHTEPHDHEERGAPAPAPDEATRQAVVNLVWALTALAFGRPARAGAGVQASERARYGLVLAQRIGRVAAGALLVAAGLGLLVIAFRAPSALAAACVTTWLAGTLTYAVVRAAVAVRGGLARHRSGVALSVLEDGARARAYRLQNASTFLPHAGFVVTFALPLGWMVDSLGAGAALSIVAIIASALVVYVGLRAVLDREVAELGIDVVGTDRP